MYLEKLLIPEPPGIAWEILRFSGFESRGPGVQVPELPGQQPARSLLPVLVPAGFDNELGLVLKIADNEGKSLERTPKIEVEYVYTQLDQPSDYPIKNPKPIKVAVRQEGPRFVAPS